MSAKRSNSRTGKPVAPVRRSFIAIQEDGHATVFQTCLVNDAPGPGCPHQLWCGCETYVFDGVSCTVMCEVGSRDTMEQAIAWADVLNEPLLFNRDGTLKAAVPNPNAQPSHGPFFRSYRPGFIGPPEPLKAWIERTTGVKDDDIPF